MKPAVKLIIASSVAFSTSMILLISTFSSAVSGNFSMIPAVSSLSAGTMGIGITSIFLLSKKIKKQLSNFELTQIDFYKKALLKQDELEKAIDGVPISKSMGGVGQVFLQGIVENDYSKLILPMEMKDILIKRIKTENNIEELEKAARTLYHIYEVAKKSNNAPAESLSAIEVIYNNAKYYTLERFKRR